MSTRKNYYILHRDEILLKRKAYNARIRASLTNEEYIKRKIKSSIYNKRYYNENKERINEHRKMKKKLKDESSIDLSTPVVKVKCNDSKRVNKVATKRKYTRKIIEKPKSDPIFSICFD
jgi:hypothetical protein